MECRFCKAPVNEVFADVGMTPLANSYLSSEQLHLMEPFYPLQAYVCGECFLVQLDEFETPSNIFSNYAYFSSYSDSWLAHAKEYTDYMMDRFDFDSGSQVIEIASNDGYLLKNFIDYEVPVLGIEPAANVAKVAQDKGIPTIVRFFGADTASELVADGISADLLLGNNVLAHVPDINDFVSGMRTILKPDGVITMEFPHLLRMIDENQFDTIYHEHFSYLSFITASKIFEFHGLALFDVQELPTHGGSLRIFAKHHDNKKQAISSSVDRMVEKETSRGLTNIETYRDFSSRIKAAKWKLLDLLISIKFDGKTIVGYGAAAKGNTLLNYCGVGTDFIDYVADRNPHKQNHFLPGSHIPIFDPQVIYETKPDYVLILPWNLKDEVMGQLGFIRDWGGKFIVPIPDVEVID